jgi:mono/diheme cytochrome c family protein
MNSLFDILLKKPLADSMLRDLLLTTFTLHILFVLLTLGTALLTLFYFVHAWYGKRLHELRWDKEILKTFLAHKTLAVVLGVAPLLLIQLGFTVPFFTAVNFIAPFWMLIIPFLIIAFLSFDTLGHKIEVNHHLHLAFGVIALFLLLIVAGVFVAVLVISENPDAWLTIVKNGYKLRRSLVLYGLLRYLHVLGAAIVFGAAFHYFFSTKEKRQKRASLLNWAVAGIVLQFVLGILLYAFLPKRPESVVNASLMVGVMATMVSLWMIYFNTNKGLPLKLKSTVPILMVLLVSMVVARKSIQDQNLLPFSDQLTVNASTYAQKLQPYAQEGLNRYKSDLAIVYDSGDVIYVRGCAFCHGAAADGKGPEAKNLTIAPEDISAVRTNRKYFRELLLKGIPGSAMPYFIFFDRDKLNDLFAYLDNRYHLERPLESLSFKVSKSDNNQAYSVFTNTCSSCHAADGKGSKLSQGFRPRPEDFTVYNLSPKRAFEVITSGYRGTAMPSFSSLPKGVRWGLVEIVNKFYRSL